MLIYKTTNMVEGKDYGKIYIGQKPTMETKDEFFASNYYGSGRLIAEAVKEFGKENFKREVIDYATTKEELNEKETKWNIFYDATNPEIGYNIALQAWPYFTGCSHSQETKKKMSESAKNKPPASAETRKKMREAALNRSTETRKKLSEAQKGKTASEETRKKMSESLKNPSEETRKKMSKASKGRVVSPETRKKMSEAHKNMSGETRKKMSEAALNRSAKSKKKQDKK